MWHVHHTMIRMIYFPLHEIYRIIVIGFICSSIMSNCHTLVFAGHFWHKSACARVLLQTTDLPWAFSRPTPTLRISCQFVVFYILYMYMHIMFSYYQRDNDSLTVYPPFCFWTRVHIKIHKFYRANSLYMLHSWCIIYAQFYWRFLGVFHFSYTDFYFRKIRCICLLIPCIVY